MSGKKQKKQVVLMIAKNFLAYHKRAGQATDFEIKIKEKDIENLKEDTIKQQKQEEEAIKKSVEDFIKVVDSTDELLGIQLTKQLKNKIKLTLLYKI